MKNFYIKTLGCKTNQTEGQIIAESLQKAGFIQTKQNIADIFILNSCAVTEHTVSQIKYLIKQAKIKNPDIKIILTGCMAQTSGEFEGADLILGNSEKLNIEKYINKLNNDIFVQDIFSKKEFENKFLYNTTSTRPPVKIQDGCNNRCSYCLIPYARGNSRSNSIENIIKQINIHAQNNIKEIVLTGIHIGQWGFEFGQSLIHLLKEIEKTDILRYRLGSLYVNEITPELMEFLINSNKFCPHFHLSLQSLCDKTLNAMNRSYTKKEALETIANIHKNFDIPYLGCDIITGFPNETKEDFLETKNALIEADMSYIHSFPYSKRKGTKAYFMEGQIPVHIKKERTKELIELAKKLHTAFLNKNKNKVRTILFEKKGKNGLYSGISENYIKVYRQSSENIRNTVIKVNLSEFEDLY